MQMTENKNEKLKRTVPVLTFAEFKQLATERKLPPGNYKIREEDKEIFLEYLKNR